MEDKEIEAIYLADYLTIMDKEFISDNKEDIEITVTKIKCDHMRLFEYVHYHNLLFLNGKFYSMTSVYDITPYYEIHKSAASMRDLYQHKTLSITLRHLPEHDGSRLIKSLYIEDINAA
ncbi:hypothetical protein [Paremcibacter congregatus]|uniref:hypothetical protein n=1 Tax=Paremcibacter congregatus TaxID=2043170 RepID=UPI0030EC0B94